jgi:hypothetical protein
VYEKQIAELAGQNQELQRTVLETQQQFEQLLSDYELKCQEEPLNI